MKTRIKCKLYTFLFRVLPIPAWQVFLMDKHLEACPLCRGDATIDEQIRKMLKYPEEMTTLPAVWPYVYRHMDDHVDSQSRQPLSKPGFSLAYKWQWKAATVGVLMLLLMAFASLFLDKKPSLPPDLSETGLTDQADQVMVKSVKIGSEAARYYFFQSKDPDKLIVWAQKK